MTAACGIVVLICLCAGIARAQVTKPILQIDEDTPAFAISADNHVAYAVRHFYSTPKYEQERDEIWLTGFEGKKARIVGLDKKNKDSETLSYQVRRIVWSPDGRNLCVEASTLEVTGARTPPHESERVFLLSSADRDVNLVSLKSKALDGAWQPAILANGAVFYLTVAVKPKKLWQINTAPSAGGPGKPIFAGHTFAGVAWDAKRNAALAVEETTDPKTPIQLELLDLLHETIRPLAAISGYFGGVSISPSGKRAAYFRDGDNIEVRELDAPAKSVLVHAPYGHYEWAPNEQDFLLKRGEPKESGEVFWIGISDADMQPALGGLPYGDFQISADGKYLGLFNPGRHGFQILPLPAPPW
jgi:WD40-like Beta Propeller Repeat